MAPSATPVDEMAWRGRKRAGEDRGPVRKSRIGSLDPAVVCEGICGLGRGAWPDLLPSFTFCLLPQEVVRVPDCPPITKAGDQAGSVALEYTLSWYT